jgi:hypothetical protein
MHSVRKGALIYVAAISAGGRPSTTSEYIRADRKKEGVPDFSTLRHENAGDQFVGRVICGLKLMSPNLAVLLPPHTPTR